MNFNNIMSKTFRFSPYILIPFFGIMIACQTASNQQAHSTPLLSAMDQNKSEVINLQYADTTKGQGPNLIASFDSMYNVEVKKGFNGSVLVAKNGKILYERYYGVANKPKNITLDPTASSQLASTSKPFTATAVLWLHENKLLDINKPVATYLKDFPYPNITVKMLLDQRSGLPNYTKMGNVVWKSNQPMYNEDLYSYFLKAKPKLYFTSDTKFNYSNTNYAFLALIIEHVSGMSYKEFLKELIFKPLGMNNTFVFDPADESTYAQNVAVSYRANYSIFPNTYEDGIYGDKGIYSTIQDMYKWDQSFYKNYILNNKTQALSHQGYSSEAKGLKNYGLGWRTNELGPAYKLIYHNGWWHGNNTVFYRVIPDKITIIVLGNKYNQAIYQHGKKVLEIMQRYNLATNLTSLHANALSGEE